MDQPEHHAEETENQRRNRIRLHVQRCTTLPSIPAVLDPIRTLASDINCSLDALATVLKRDQACVAHLLQIANSALYGFNRSVISVRQAILLLGLNTISDIVQSATGGPSLRPHNTAGTSLLQEIWLHSYAVATLAQHIAMDAAHLRIDQEVAYCAGLLHDIGRVVLLELFPDEYPPILASSPDDMSNEITQRELDTFYASHTQVGRWLGEQWNFPAPILQTISTHHHTQQTNELVSIVKLADQLVKSLHIGFVQPHTTAPQLDELLRALNLHPRRVQRYEAHIRAEITHLQESIALSVPPGSFSS